MKKLKQILQISILEKEKQLENEWMEQNGIKSYRIMEFHVISGR